MPINFNQRQWDILREAGNICAGNATVALSHILFRKIELHVPRLQLVELDKMEKIFTQNSNPLIGIHMETLGAVEGSALLIFQEESGYTLMEMVVGGLGKQTRVVTQIGISALKEVGNIVISSYLSTLSSLSRLPVFPSCPQFISGMPLMIMKNAFNTLERTASHAVLIETFFQEPITAVSGRFFIAFDPLSIKRLLKAFENHKR